MRAIFFDEEHAAAVVARLVRDGFAATMERERLAGEDDDEDHPWAVLSDAPEFVLEVLVDEHDGWLDHDDVPAPVAGRVHDAGHQVVQHLPLPSQPRRVKRPDLLGD